MYIPKSQIKTNLYTSSPDPNSEADMDPNTKFYVLSTNKEPYTGFYYELTNGQKFTGKYPGDGPNILLIESKYNNTPQLDANNPFIYYIDSGEVYNQIKSINQSKIEYLPQYLPTIPTNKDYQTGEYTRYFCKKINELLYVEISKDYYQKLVKKDTSVAFEYYLPFNISWRLAGKINEVYDINKNIVTLTMKNQKLPMFNRYIKEDYTKYYK
tara:strand:- start:16 stop:651 length:636 start_codon:yes stop_codon:yes gene_type:complete